MRAAAEAIFLTSRRARRFFALRLTGCNAPRRAGLVNIVWQSAGEQRSRCFIAELWESEINHGQVNQCEDEKEKGDPAPQAASFQQI